MSYFPCNVTVLGTLFITTSTTKDPKNARSHEEDGRRAQGEGHRPRQEVKDVVGRSRVDGREERKFCLSERRRTTDTQFQCGRNDTRQSSFFLKLEALCYAASASMSKMIFIASPFCIVSNPRCAFWIENEGGSITAVGTSTQSPFARSPRR